jgi:hypothetical protein
MNLLYNEIIISRKATCGVNPYITDLLFPNSLRFNQNLFLGWKLMKRYVCRITLILSCLMVFSSLQVFAQKEMTMDQAVALISATRTKVEYRVKKIKKNFAPDTTQYKKAEDLYENVAAEAQGFSDAITIAVKQGRKPEGLDSVSENFSKEADTFVKYCNTALKIDGNVDPFSIFGVGKFFWEFYKKERQEKRDTKAEKIATTLKFKDWDEIK